MPQAKATENSYWFAKGPCPVLIARKISERVRKASASWVK